MNTAKTVNTEFLKGLHAVTLTLRSFGNSRKVNVEELKDDATPGEKRRVKGQKKLIVAQELDDVVSHLADTKTMVKLMTMPFPGFKAGIFLAKNELAEEINNRLIVKRDELAPLVQKLVDVFPSKVDDAGKELGALFNPSDYPQPSRLPALFSIEWNWIAFTVPEGLPPELRAAEEAKLQQKFQEAEQEITIALREGFQQLIAHAVEKLRIDPGDKPKIFRDSLVGNILEFIDTFKARNLTNDTDLESLVDKAKRIVTDLDPEDLRKDKGFRQKTAEKFSEVQGELEKMIVEMPGRKFNFEEQE